MTVSLDVIKERIGMNIRNARTRKELTQQQLAEILGVSEKTVLRHEAGNGLSIEKVHRYAEALECNPAELLLSFDESVNAAIRLLMTCDLKTSPSC